MGTNGTFKNTGNVVLQHEIDNTTMTLALKYLPKIQKAYKHVVDIATCQNITYPYQEKTVKFAGFANATGTKPEASSSPAPSASQSSSSNVSAQAGEDSAAGIFAANGAVIGTVAVALAGLLL